ncbi:TPA: CooT family nickel-binding protein [Candidatus Bipolaricaulota bacterium]|nr:CooT family nickel-binding protein [Candidatus Bipolaricaulota bacterium]
MCEIVVLKEGKKIAEGVIEFRYEEGRLILRRLFEEELELKGVKRFEWREKDDTLRILE